MLEEVLRTLKNYFIREVHVGTFTIEDGSISADFLTAGQYFRIYGSIFNDGVHQYPAYDLNDETFTGEIWAMAVPGAVIALSEDIAEWKNKYETVDSCAMSPYNSESFGGYSYSKSTGDGTGASNSGAWQNVFASRLNQWRKIRYESPIRSNDTLRYSK